MMDMPSMLLRILAALSFISFSSFAVLSIFEKEKKAARSAFLIALIAGFSFTGFSFMPEFIKLLLLYILMAVSFFFIIAFFMPIGQISFFNPTPNKRVDERKIMFARFRLQPGTENFQTYYQLHPEDLASDERTRAKPGLLSPRARYAHPHLFSAAQASFFLTDALHAAVEGPVSEQTTIQDPAANSQFLKDLCCYFGALDAGICSLEPYHVYSHIGRGPGIYGQPLEPEHRFAIAFTVEMDYEMVGANPTTPGIMESARQYVEASKIAAQVAAAIRHLGYPARAHIDGNYRVIAPLVARDAGLGDIGRMGLLMTPKQGPRIRIGVVTTDIPLRSDQRQPNAALLDFCTLCKKCADCCPSQSIPWDDRQLLNGIYRWQINPDTCYHYWAISGTDCGRCMTVCPYAHPNNFAHNLVRWGIQQSGFFRRIAIRMDDFFYGKKTIPASRSKMDKITQRLTFCWA